MEHAAAGFFSFELVDVDRPSLVVALLLYHHRPHSTYPTIMVYERTDLTLCCCKYSRGYHVRHEEETVQHHQPEADPRIIHSKKDVEAAAAAASASVASSRNIEVEEV